MANEEVDVADLMDALSYVEECVGAIRAELGRRSGATAETAGPVREIPIPLPNRSRNCEPAYVLSQDRILRLRGE